MSNRRSAAPSVRFASARRPFVSTDEKDAAVHGPRVASVGVFFALLGAAAYLAAVLFAIGDGGLSADSDVAAGRVTLGVAAGLSGVGLVLGLAGLGKRGQRGAGFVAFVLGAAFVAFTVYGFWRG